MRCVTNQNDSTVFPSRKLGRRPSWVNGVDFGIGYEISNDWVRPITAALLELSLDVDEVKGFFLR